MSDLSISARRLSPSAKAGLSIFARYATILGLAAMIAVFSILSPDAFPTFNNFINVLNQASLAMIIAGGLTLAVIVGELDLSIGYAASLHGVLVTGLIVHDKLPIALAIAIVLALGALVGVVNGLIVTKLRVNSVIATLGVGTIIVGLAFAYSSGVPIRSRSAAWPSRFPTPRRPLHPNRRALSSRLANFEIIRDDFAALDDWEDRSCYVIELGHTLEPLGEAAHNESNKVRGWVTQV